MKFETYVYKIVLDHQPNFHKDPCKDARARGVNARTHVKKNLCVRSLGYIVGASPPCENMCVRSLGYIVGAPPPFCVSIQLVTLWVRPPLVCVLLLEDNLRWILACCLLRFAAFLF